MADGERDLPTHQVHAGALQVAQRPGLRHRQQLQRRLGGTGEALELRGVQRATGAMGGIERELQRALQERRRGRVPAARPGAAGGALELCRHVLVGTGGRLRAVPGAAIGVELGVGRLAERPVHELALLLRRRTVDGGTHQRVAEADVHAEREQPGGVGGLGRLAEDVQARGRAQDHHRVADRLGGGDQ